MVTTLQVEQMSRTEKLQVMETLWAALSVPDSEMESPAWHADALRETEDRASRGEERMVDWDVAKRALRNRFE
ncbi:MAG: addiction module protein [Kiritimatiellae bacterium]|nr:addiction module protein [Kiritimatiellia bacterium]